MNVNIETLFKFSKEAEKLVNNSKYSERIKLLLGHPHYGEIENTLVPFTHPNYNQAPNCFGTLSWILEGETEFPTWLDRGEFNMRYLIEENRTGKCEKDSIIAFWSGERLLQHAGLYLGECLGMKAMFHQPNTGEEFAIDPVEKHMDWYPGLAHYDFFIAETKIQLKYKYISF